MDHKIILLGAGSTLGRSLTELLKKEDVDLTVASRSLKKLPEGVKCLQVDYRNPQMMDMALKDREILFLKLSLDCEFQESSRNILRAAKLNGVRFILAITGVRANNHSEHLCQRMLGEWEEEVARSKLRYCFLRPNIMMQSWLEESREDLESGVLCRPDGEGRISLVDAQDVAELASKILLHPMIFHRQTLEVTGSKSYSISDMTSFLSFHAGKRMNYVPVTEEAFKKLPSFKKMHPMEEELLLSRHRALKAGEFSWISGHYEKIMGKEPRRFEDFCAERAPELRNDGAFQFLKDLGTG